MSVKDRIKNMEAPAPAPVEAEAPKRISVKDRIKQAEAVGASGENAEESAMSEVVTKTQVRVSSNATTADYAYRVLTKQQRQ